MASRGELDTSECDWTLEGDPDGGLLHPVLAVEPGGPRDRPTAEVPLYWETERQTKQVRQTHIQ